MLKISGPAHKIAVLITYVQMPLMNSHADISSKAKGLNFGLSLYLHSYFVYWSSKGSSESVHMCRQTCLSLRFILMELVLKSCILAHLNIYGKILLHKIMMGLINGPIFHLKHM